MTTKIPVGLKKTASMVVLQNQEAYLLLKRKNAPNQGMFVPVGGKLDPFESPRAAAIRETMEETGIELKEVHFGGVLIETSPSKYNWQSYIYTACIDWQEPPPCDEGELVWKTFDELPSIPTPPTDWMIYNYLKENRRFIFNAIYDQSMALIEMVEEIEGKKVI